MLAVSRPRSAARHDEHPAARRAGQATSGGGSRILRPVHGRRLCGIGAAVFVRSALWYGSWMRTMGDSFVQGLGLGLGLDLDFVRISWGRAIGRSWGFLSFGVSESGGSGLSAFGPVEDRRLAYRWRALPLQGRRNGDASVDA